MKIIKPSFEIWEQKDPCKQIELAGRVCYKSEDNITEDSAKPFVERMIKSKHYAMLEHGTIYLKIPYNVIHRLANPGLCSKYFNNPYSKVVDYYEPSSAIGIQPNDYMNLNCDVTPYLAVTTNFRVIKENGWENDLQYLCEPTDYHEKRITVHFTCDMGVAREFCRHRVFSFAQESTRYCNYSKDRFGNELTFIKPCWRNIDMSLFLRSLQNAETSYIKLIEDGWKPEEAREVLPLALKTELVMTGFVSDFNHFFDLRALGTTGKPHPQAKQLALPLYEEFIKRGYINNN